MNPQRIQRMFGILVAGTIGFLSQGGSRAVAADLGASYDQSGVEVLTRGPVHEAFAEPVAYNPAQGAVISRHAPANIEEMPPEDKPEGENVQWIPGYWSWDGDRGDFIWVSGVWRDPPPDRGWVPGYWTPVAGGWTWTSGFWTAAESDEVEYLPQPPISMEIGPSSPQPDADRLWSPGCWKWSEFGYVWRPGYWVTANPDWVWSPAHYVWTPRGYVYIDGYWDLSLDRRGVLFAPMYAQASVYSRQGYVYTPTIVIQIGFLTAALFESPNYHHYYFGDYYGDEYSSRGYRPWFEADSHYRGYDPIYAHQRWEHQRTDTRWEQNVRESYDYRRQHVDARPSRTYATQAAAIARAPERERKSLAIAAPIREITTRRDVPVRFEKVDTARRQAIGGKAKEVVKYRDERVKWESSPRKTGKVEPAAQDLLKRSQEPRIQPLEQRTQTSRNRPANERINKTVEKARTSEPRKAVGESKRSNEQTRQIQRTMERPVVQPKAEKASSRAEAAAVQRVKISKSPVSGRRIDNSSKGNNPPSRPDVSKSDSPKSDSNTRSKSEVKDSSGRDAPAARASSSSEGKGQNKQDQKDKPDNAGKKKR